VRREAARTRRLPRPGAHVALASLARHRRRPRLDLLVDDVGAQLYAAKLHLEARARRRMRLLWGVQLRSEEKRETDDWRKGVRLL
jgi:hypothetical protein